MLELFKEPLFSVSANLLNMIAMGLIALFAILFVFMAYRLIRRPRLAGGRRSRNARLAITDAALVDERRKLVLVRRDNVEHLVMIGGATDIVIESNIRKNAPQEATASAPLRTVETTPVSAPPAPAAAPTAPPAEVKRAPEPARERASAAPARPSVSATAAPVAAAASAVTATAVTAADAVKDSVADAASTTRDTVSSGIDSTSSAIKSEAQSAAAKVSGAIQPPRKPVTSEATAASKDKDSWLSDISLDRPK